MPECDAEQLHAVQLHIQIAHRNSIKDPIKVNPIWSEQCSTLTKQNAFCAIICSDSEIITTEHYLLRSTQNRIDS